jgi:hypothetical protein
VRTVVSVVVVAALQGSALAQSPPATCTTEHAIYEAAKGARDKFEPDKLWFDYKRTGRATPHPEFPERVVIHSRQLDRHFTFETYMSNNSGMQGMTMQIPASRNRISPTPKAFEIETLIYSVNQKLEVGGIPAKDEPAPELIIFPGFWPLAHSSYNGTVGIGMQRQIFRFARCETQPG